MLKHKMGALSKKGMVVDMKKRRFLTLVLLLCILLYDKDLPVRAESVWHSSLIQATDYQEEYEGALHLGLLEQSVLNTPDIEYVAEEWKDCIVRIICKDQCGSGMIWSLTADDIVIVTNAHVMVEDKAGITFYQGFEAEGSLKAYSEKNDIAFLTVSLQKLPPLQWETLRYIDLKDCMLSDREEEKEMEKGTPIVQLASGKMAAGDTYYGDILNANQYNTELGMDMLVTSAYAYPGMSGGAVFDACGNLLGMITAGKMSERTGTDGSETTYAIPVSTIMEECMDIFPGSWYDE